jgi:hypothetical protein
MRLPEGWDPAKPIPKDVLAQHMPGVNVDTLPPMYYSAPAGEVANVPVYPGSAAPTLNKEPVPGVTPPNPYDPRQSIANRPDLYPSGDPNAPGAPGTGKLPFGAKTPIEAFQSTMSAVGSIAGDAFTIFGDVIKNIDAAANTEDVMHFIDQMQTFITTAADVAHLVGDIGGLVGGASGGMDMGAGSAIQAAAGIVQSGLEATNMAIDLGQQVYEQVAKYTATFAGLMLGGANTGPLGGNVRMLLNTNTGQIYAYSEDNPQNKETHNMAPWLARSYGGPNPNAQPNVQQSTVNIYAGPGQSPRDMMNETMWLVSTGGAPVASVAGQD